MAQLRPGLIEAEFWKPIVFFWPREINLNISGLWGREKLGAFLGFDGWQRKMANCWDEVNMEILRPYPLIGTCSIWQENIVPSLDFVNIEYVSNYRGYS